MIVISQNIKINSSADKIFNFVSNYEKDVMWRKNVKRMKVTGRKAGIVGSTTEEVLKFLGSTYLTVSEISEFEKDKKISFRSLMGKVKSTGYRQLYGQNGNTELKYYLEIEPAGMMKLTGGVLKYFFNKQLTKDLLTLKNILEK